jgi:hypothetical protein
MEKSEFKSRLFANTLHEYPMFHISCLIFLTLLLFTNLPAQGNLMIFPKRLVFEGAKKYQELNLINIGKDTARYVISIVNYRMKEDGGFEKITQPDSGQKFADEFIRFFPRSVEIPPNESQAVKVQLTRTKQLVAGEYRSHLFFRAEPDKKPLGQKDSTMDTNAVTVQIKPVFGISIAAIIRVGESTVRASFSDLSLDEIADAGPTLSMVFNRSGNVSVYGDITVDHISPDGTVTRVGEVQGVAVYTPNLMRRSRINLKKAPGVNFNQGKLHVIYSAQQEDEGSKIAEAELQLR